MIRRLLCLVCWSMLTAPGSAQRLATFTVPPTPGGLDLPVTVDLDQVTPVQDSALSLYRVSGSHRTPVPFQVQEGEVRTLHWIVPGDRRAGEEIVYELVRRTTSARGATAPDGPAAGATAPGDAIGTSAGEARVSVLSDDSTYTLQSGTHPLLRYNHATVYPPPGVDSAFRRSGFIHPLWTPHGQVLTRIQAPDHYHHYGLWNPWTHVLFEGDTVDFWNLGGKKGTVRFARLLNKDSGPVYAQIRVLHEHVVLKNNKVALSEVQTIRAYRPSKDKDNDYYYLDITSELSCATESPVLLLTYRYGGLGWRATPLWNKDNSEVLTSEGRDRKGADGSTARWCIVQGALNDDYGGAVMLSYPANYNHPEPLRVWPENTNGKGDLFANFDPTKDRDWLLEPGKTYVLRYRLVVFNGKFDKEKAESAWQYFANPPYIIIR